MLAGLEYVLVEKMMNSNYSISVIIPSYNTPEITKCAALSFIKHFKNTEVIIVENSNYKWENIKEDIKIIHAPTLNVGSVANADGIMQGLKYATGDFIFTAHSDVFVLPNFYNHLISLTNNFQLIGTWQQQIRSKALHISGLCVKSDIIRNIDIYPKYLKGGNYNYDMERYAKNIMEWRNSRIETDPIDVGDNITLECRKNNIKTYCMENNINNQLMCNCYKYKGIAAHYSFLNNKEIYLHKGRLTLYRIEDKAFEKIGMKRRNGLGKEEEWLNIINDLL